ncbi:MAG: 2OG-Fe(II) oxygenase [Alphaproteobacteria bacterium]
MFWYPVPERGSVSHIDFPPFVTGHSLFSDQEMDLIIKNCLAQPGQDVTVGRDMKKRDEENISTRRHIMPGQDTQWIYQRVVNMVSVLNSQCYQYDVSGMDEPLYFVTYDGSKKGHYNWHYDGTVAGMAPRKLSITFQLSAPGDYQGGELEFNRTGNPTSAPKDRGTFVMFPSFILHRVRPVTKGIRHALVAWVNGPPFR